MFLKRGVASLALVWLFAMPTEAAENGRNSVCSPGAGLLDPSVVGPLIIDEGNGFGAVRMGSTVADVERAWGPPAGCGMQQSRFSYEYILTTDGGQTGLVILVVFHAGVVEWILAMLPPHSEGRGPVVRTRRGIRLVAPVDDVRRTHGDPTSSREQVWIYAGEGIGFVTSSGLVGGFLVFKAGAPPPDWMK